MAHRPSKSDVQDTSNAKSLRSMGSYTDVHSMSAKSTRATLPPANPLPAYISETEAEGLIYAELDQPVKISEGALHLVNGFLDQILYDILSRSHSTALSSIRSAVPVVLKQRLGRSAVKAGDEELQDYIEEDEMEEVLSTPAVLDPTADFDVDLAWRLTRLRCMVYAKLGDMEEEDEEDYLEDDDLRDHIGHVKERVKAAAVIAPAAAIFLTTVLEFLGEQAVCIAAQHATKRHANLTDPTREAPSNGTQDRDQKQISLEEIDMSGVGKEGPLIRLWRSWKGNVRAGGSMSSRPTTPSIMSPSSPDSSGYDWKFPIAPPISTIHEERSPSIQPKDSLIPADVPIPLTERDVEEIEVPGLARSFEDENEESVGERPALEKRRPSSMLVMPGKFPDSMTPAADQNTERPSWNRKRSHSVPASSPPPSGAGASLDGIEQRSTTGDVISPEVVQTRPDEPADIEEQVSSASKPQSESGGRSNTINTAVATIAGALSVEASRGSRKDRSTQDQYALNSPATPVEVGHSNQTAQPPIGLAIHSLGDGEIPPIATGEPEVADDPEDLALSSSDEGDGQENVQSNPRDSGFGVAGPEDQLLALDQTEHPLGHDPPAAYHVPSSNRPGQAQRGVDGANAITPEEAYAASYARAEAATELNNLDLVPLPQGPARSNIPVAASTSRPPNGATAAATSAWSTAAQGRTSSLENRATGRLPTEVRFPQHLPVSQRGNEKTPDHHQERPPRYATSSSAAGHGGSGSATSGQVAHPQNIGAGKEDRPTPDGSATARRQHIRLRPDTEDKPWIMTQPDELDRAKKSLDVLIDSDETLHYTLTPKSAREGIKPKVKSQTQELADFFRTTAPPGDEPARPKSSRSTKEAVNGLRSYPPGSPKPPIPINIRPVTSQSNIQQTPISPARAKNPVGEPRDARMTRNTTRDLADYARSTGPENEMQLPKALGTRPSTGQGNRSLDGPGSTEEAFDAMGESRPSTTSGKPANRLKYQARDARAPRTTESSDLIDFIREGPPRAAGDHRIDRKVAPFRSTMDSDDLNALAPPPELDVNGRNSDGSAQESAMTVKSMPSSMNSRTGLLDSTNRAVPKFTNGLGSNAVSRQPMIPEADGMPKKTRSRVRDPYAIDFSDEEEAVEEVFPPPRRRPDEESLVDFLRNTAPPPGMTTQPILAAQPSPTQPDPAAMVKRTTSSSKLRDYLQGSTSTKNVTTMKATNGARAESPHLTQVGSKVDKYRPTQPTHAAHVDRNRQKMRAEPRQATLSNDSETADLAAYLKNSGPPPGSEIPSQRFNTTAKDQAGFMKFFQRRGSVRK